MDSVQNQPDESKRELLKSPLILAAISFGYLVLDGCSSLSDSTMAKGQTMNTEGNDRFVRGWKKLKEIDGDAGEKVIESLKNIAPDLGRYTIEYPFGDIYSRQGLDLKSREVATVAALSAMGNAEPQLRVHINAALNVGCTPEEIVEIIIQMSVYAGFPAALNAASAAKMVFAERGIINV